MGQQGRLRQGLPAEVNLIGSTVTPRAPEPVIRRAERYQQLEAQRAIAVVIIVVFHVFQYCDVAHNLYRGTPAYRFLDSLDAMVPWFFVITAFLLFEPIARSVVDGRHGFSARAFLRRRAVRIVPAYYVVVLVVWFSRQHSLPGDWRDLLEHLTFTQVFDEKRIFYTNGPASALSVEVFFYLLLVLISVAVLAAGRRLASRRWRITLLVATTTLLAAVSVAWKAWSFAVEHRPTTGSFTTWFGPVANFDAFAVGMAVAVVAATLKESRPLSSRRCVGLRVVALAIIAAAFVTRQANTWPAVYFYSACSVGFGGLVAAAVFGPCGDRWDRVLSCRPLLAVGAISYGIYLWHEPTMLALPGLDGLVRQAPSAFLRDSVVVLVASTLTGWLSFYLVERPSSQLGGIFRHDGSLAVPVRSAGDKVQWEDFRRGSPF